MTAAPAVSSMLGGRPGTETARVLETAAFTMSLGLDRSAFGTDQVCPACRIPTPRLLRVFSIHRRTSLSHVRP